MGIDIETYRSRIGCSRQNYGRDVVHFTVHMNFTRTIKCMCIFPLLLLIFLLFIDTNVLFWKGAYHLNDLDLSRSCSAFTGFHLCIAGRKISSRFKCHGVVVFIGLLLVMAGIETNPGPLPEKDETKVNDDTERLQKREERESPVDKIQASKISSTQAEDGACCNSMEEIIDVEFVQDLIIQANRALDAADSTEEQQGKMASGRSRKNRIGESFRRWREKATVQQVKPDTADATIEQGKPSSGSSTKNRIGEFLRKQYHKLWKGKGKPQKIQTGNTGEEFLRQEHTLPIDHLTSLSSVKYSIGLIVIKVNQDQIPITSTGTGFVVGDGYLMTAGHVIKHQIESILDEIFYVLKDKPLKRDDLRKWCVDHLDGEELETEEEAVKCYYKKSKQKNLEGLVGSFKDYMASEDYRTLEEILNRKWFKEVTVNFKKPNESVAINECMLSPDIPFLDEAIDVAILKIKRNGCELPDGLILDDAVFGYDKVNLCGYIKKKMDENPELTLDPQCVIYTSSSSLAKDVRDAKNWWKKTQKLQDKKDKGKYSKIDFGEEYKNCVIQDGQVLLHASESFLHGTSGSPMIVCKMFENTMKPVVVGIYLRGFPMFYYKLKRAIETNDPLIGKFRHFNKFRDLVMENEMNRFIDLKYFMEGGTTMKHVSDNIPAVDFRNLLFSSRITNDRRQTNTVYEESTVDQFGNATDQRQTAAQNEEITRQQFGNTTDQRQTAAQNEEITREQFGNTTDECNMKDQQSDCDSLNSSIEKSSDTWSPSVFQSKSIQTDALEQQSFEIRQKLGLENYFPRKITLADVMKMPSRTDVAVPTAFHWGLLQELIMVNFEARDRCPHDLYKLLQTGHNDTDKNFNDANINANCQIEGNHNNYILTNHDILISIFTCCDHSLKQVLVSKMFLCRLAVPLIYPTFGPGSLCFSLWPLRFLTLEAKHTSLFICPQKVVSFIRLSRPKFSKSYLINAVISNEQNQHHPTFYNKDCYLGMHKREITNGLVEASWYQPGGQDPSSNAFHEIVMFTNLRGDAVDHVFQMDTLTDMSNCIVVTVDCGDVKKHVEYLKALERQAKSLILFLTGENSHVERSEFRQYGLDITIMASCDVTCKKNISDLREEMQENISKKLQITSETNLEACSLCAFNRGIQVDEHERICQLSSEPAVAMSNQIEKICSTDIKKTLLPLQEIWKVISKHTKNLKRTTKSKVSSISFEDENATSALSAKDSIKQEITKLRLQQAGLIGSDSLANTLIEVLAHDSSSSEHKSYFLEWVKFYFDKRSHQVLPELMNNYQKCRMHYHKARQHGRENEIDELKKEMQIEEQKLSNASIGLEHILREMGQIYESRKESKTFDFPGAFHGLPEIAVNLLKLGYPLELIDGDAGNLPVDWIKSVFDACIRSLGDKRVFIISILGIQSSGKSTFLNSLFGLQFAVSAGRCTKGVYLQMIPVDSSCKLPIDYLLVVDTEGLRSPELLFQQHDHDNELATLAVGIADMTIINIKGENPSEMKDVLEIVIYALLRLKLANANLNFDTSCTFVHQNVSASNADSKMKLGQQKLEELLDEVTKHAAAEVGMKNTNTFAELITFNINTDVWYLPDLWHGGPPMAHINPGYSKKVKTIKKAIFEQIKSKSSTRCLTTTIAHIMDLWNGILSEDFVFCFRSSIEIKAYNKMESEYKKLTWELQGFQMNWMIRNGDRIGQKTDEIEKQFKHEFRLKFENASSKLKIFFEDSAYKQELLKWKNLQLSAFETFSNDLKKISIGEIIEKRKQKHLQEQRKKMTEVHLEKFTEEAKSLAKNLKGKKPPKKDLNTYFENMWSNLLTRSSPSDYTATTPLEDHIDETLIGFKKQLQAQMRKEIDEQGLGNAINELSHDSEFLVCKSDIHVHVRDISDSNRRTKDIIHRLVKKAIQWFQRQLFAEIQLQTTQDIGNSYVLFKNAYLDKLLNMIDCRINQHNDDRDNDFEFLPQYRVMIMVYVSRYVLHVYTEVKKRYDEDNSQMTIIDKSKPSTWRFFENLVDEKTHDFIAARLICETLKTKINDTLQEQVAITIESRVRAYLEHSKVSLIVKMLDQLATDEDFEMYKEYLISPGAYALKWITKYTNDRFFNKSEYVEIVREHIGRCIDEFKSDVNEAGKKCRSIQTSRMQTFILSVKRVSIPEHIAKQICEYELNDVDNFLSEMHQMLDDLQKEAIEERATKTYSTIKWKRSPYTSIYEGLWGCKEVCPLCREPCQKMEKHDDVKEPHTCIQHRPEGVIGIHEVSTQKLIIESCSFLVQSDITGTCSLFKNGCKKYENCNETNDKHPFKKYKTYLPDWDIAPSSDMESSKYWMWFMAIFGKDLADWYLSKEPNIPESWKCISKEDAQNSLRMCYGY